jgi:hypothetical protein
MTSHQRASPGEGLVHAVLLRKIGSCSSSYHISKPRGCAGVFYGFKQQEAFVLDLIADQGLCILGSEDGVVEGMYAHSRQFVLGDWRD